MTRFVTGDTATVDLLLVEGGAASGTATIDSADPVFVGHYPGFPVLPGVYNIELADRMARLVLGGAGEVEAGNVELAAVQRCRFLAPVYPGDNVNLDAVLSGDADSPLCTVKLSTRNGPAAEIRLRYRVGSATGAGNVIGPAEIRRIIPHRYPILLVDRVTEIVPGERLVATKAVTVNEPCYRTVPDSAVSGDYSYPTGLLIESWAQAGVLLAVWDKPNPDVLAGKVELAGAISQIRLHQPVYPGDLLEHHARIVKTVGDTAILEGETRVGTQTVMELGQFVLALRSVEDLRPRDTPAMAL